MVFTHFVDCARCRSSLPGCVHRLPATVPAGSCGPYAYLVHYHRYQRYRTHRWFLSHIPCPPSSLVTMVVPLVFPCTPQPVPGRTPVALPTHTLALDRQCQHHATTTFPMNYIHRVVVVGDDVGALLLQVLFHVVCCFVTLRTRLVAIYVRFRTTVRFDSHGLPIFLHAPGTAGTTARHFATHTFTCATPPHIYSFVTHLLFVHTALAVLLVHHLASIDFCAGLPSCLCTCHMHTPAHTIGSAPCEPPYNWTATDILVSSSTSSPAPPPRHTAAGASSYVVYNSGLSR